MITEKLDEILDLLIDAAKLMERGKYTNGSDKLDIAEPLLKTITPKEAGPSEYYYHWGYYFEIRINLLGHLGKPAEQEAVVRELFQRFPFSAGELGSEDLLRMRVAYRAAYGALVSIYTARKDFASATDAIEKCFALDSAEGETADGMRPYYELKALTYLEASASDPATYRQAFNEALELLEKKAKKSTVVTITDERLHAALQAKDDLKPAAPKETWQEALERYKKAYEKLDVQDDYDHNQLRIFKKETDPIPGKQPFPASLRELYLRHGAFELRDPDEWGSMLIYGGGEGYFSNCVGLIAAIDRIWGGRPEFSRSFTQEEIDYLNRNYISFGHLKHDSNAYTHFFFDGKGGFGRIYYNQDDWDAAFPVFKSLLSGWTAPLTLDELVSDAVTVVIEALEEDGN